MTQPQASHIYCSMLSVYTTTGVTYLLQPALRQHNDRRHIPIAACFPSTQRQSSHTVAACSPSTQRQASHTHCSLLSVNTTLVATYLLQPAFRQQNGNTCSPSTQISLCAYDKLFCVDGKSIFFRD